jgi:hypothetical protein
VELVEGILFTELKEGMLFVEQMKVVGDWLWCSDRIGNRLGPGIGCLDNSAIGRMKDKMENTGYETNVIALCGSLL